MGETVASALIKPKRGHSCVERGNPANRHGRASGRGQLGELPLRGHHDLGVGCRRGAKAHDRFEVAASRPPLPKQAVCRPASQQGAPVARLTCEKSVKRGDRRIERLACEIRAAEEDTVFPRSGRELDRLLEGPDCISGTRTGLVRQPEIAVDQRILGRQGCGALEDRDRRIRRAVTQQRNAGRLTDGSR